MKLSELSKRKKSSSKLIGNSMLNKKVFFLFFFLFASCNTPPNYERMSDRMVSKYVKEIKKEYGFQVDVIGGGMMGAVNLVTIGFAVQQNVDKNQGRRIAVECVEKLLKKYNENEQIRPFLKNYPFDTSNIKMYLSFIDENRDRVDKKYIALITIGNNVVCYSKYDPETKWFFDDQEESYDEALRIVEAEKIKQ